MKYIEDDWDIRVNSYRPKGMSVPEPKTYVEFKHKHTDILIRYGEEKATYKNKELIISLIELL